jgi:hypothetical protein
MGISICTDWDNNVQTLFCNTSDFAFGPVFYPNEDNYTAEDFLEWYKGEDIRRLTDSELEAKVGEFRTRYVDKDLVPFKDVCVIEIEDIFADDYPDFVDAQVSAAEWKEDGRALTEGELESLNYQNIDEVQEAARIEYLENVA